MNNAASTFFAKVAILLAPRVCLLDEVGHRGVVCDAEVREDGGSAEGAGGLLAAVGAVAMEEHEGGRKGGCEGHGAAGAGAVHGGDGWANGDVRR